jgi:RNA polymerase sigma-70 factor (ECF subfamily)
MESAESLHRLKQASLGDQAMLGELLAKYRPRLRRMVRLRLDRRLQGRVDQSDIIQEAYLEAAQRLPEYVHNPTMPFFLWLRFIAMQRLALAQRRHLGTRAREAGREVALHAGALPHATSAALAAGLIGKLTSPSNAVARTEMKLKLQDALNAMEPLDREILALRHFEQLSNLETAVVLDIKPTAASNRYVRALERLRVILTATGNEGSSLPS